MESLKRELVPAFITLGAALAVVAFCLLVLGGCTALRGALAAPPGPGPVPTTVGGEITKGIADFVQALLPYLFGAAGVGLTGFGIQKAWKGGAVVVKAPFKKPPVG